jgi:ZIP family zinc transporter
MHEAILWILLISVLGPIVGSFIGVIRKPSEAFMYNMLAFAGGVMLAVSFMELIPRSIELSSIWIASIGILAGSIVMFSVDKLIPHIHPELCSQEQGCRLKKTATYLIIGIFLHNFPEGMAIAIGAVSETNVAILIAIAIAIQNVPEGICTATPYWHCTGKRLRSFLISSSTAIPIVIGFLIASLLYSVIPLSLVGLIVGATAGFMIYITADEIIPASSSRSSNHRTIFSLIIGIMLVVVLGGFL